MKSRVKSTKPNADQPKTGVNPWLIIFWGATFALAIVGFLLYRWSLGRSNFGQMASQLIKRQNTVLAHDAMHVATQVGNLLENAARDVQSLALIPPSTGNLTKFYLSRVAQLNQIDPQDDSMTQVPLPLYNEVIVLNVRGDERIRLKDGKSETRLRSLSQCSEKELCDRKLIQTLLNLPVGEVHFGRVMRFYTPQDSKEIENGSSYLPVGYRGADGIYILGIDYRFLQEVLLQPTFPYDRKRNLLQAYQNGNYVYLVDSFHDFLIHPKPWHVTGIDRQNGGRRTPMKTDADEGSHPLNISAYQSGRLKEYFDRLKSRSFVAKGVDIFEATNLKGVSRVLSVAPIPLHFGQYRDKGIFGFVVLGCSVEYFEEPKEQYVPYY